MVPIFFETATAGRNADGKITIALFDRSTERGELTACMAILECPVDSAIALIAAVGSALNDAS